MLIQRKTEKSKAYGGVQKFDFDFHVLYPNFLILTD